MELKITQDFDWAHRHVDIKSYKVGDPNIETEDEDLIEVSQREGWTIDANAEEDEGGEETPPAKRGKRGAPENKDLAESPENK